MPYTQSRKSILFVFLANVPNIILFLYLAIGTTRTIAESDSRKVLFVVTCTFALTSLVTIVLFYTDRPKASIVFSAGSVFMMIAALTFLT